MPFDVTDNGGVTVLVVKDHRLDALVADSYKTDLKALLDSGKVRLCVDLGQVQFIDSSGLNVLIFGTRAARDKKGGLKVACLAPAVRDLFAMTRVDKMIPIFGSVEEAVGSFPAA